MSDTTKPTFSPEGIIASDRAVTCEMSDGSTVSVHREDGKLRLMVQTPGTHGHGFRFSAEQTAAIERFVEATKALPSVPIGLAPVDPDDANREPETVKVWRPKE